MGKTASELEQYWIKYSGNAADAFDEDWRATIGNFTSGYICPQCGQWINPGEYHTCYPYGYTFYYPARNKTEEAFKILKLLVEKKVSEEPKSFKEFCELVEKIAKLI